ncbi:MAG: hypothetical protein LBD48_12850 [Treponema sp.]|jgi:hypothetical protein|nr:hypothetical protein [Treponema sp.]
MTLSGRNILFKTGIAVASFSALLIIFASFTVIPVYSGMEAEITRRSEGFFQAFISRFLDADLYAVHAAIAGSVAYALVALILIYHYFETTQSPEIMFIVLFVVSFSFEAIRLILPLRNIYDIPSLYLLMAFRALLFSRYFGIFSLFTASVYAAGLEVQKHRNVILAITVATLVIALGVPIDTQTWDSSLNMINGYVHLFRLIETGTALITVISFFIAASSRGSREYTFTGVGALMTFIGRNLLLSTDTWISPIPGILLLSIGMWFICTQLHKIYLWL